MRLKFIFSKLLLLCALSMAFPALSSAQTPAGIPADTSLKIIQFSGLAVDADSLTPLPYVAIIIRNSQRGVYSNLNGYYSIVAQEKDTVDFYALGYHKATYVLPDTFTTDNYTLVQALRIDTILLREAIVYPWPSKDQFKNAFLSADVPADDYERARANLSQAEMVRVAQNVAMDGGGVYNATMQQQTARNYYAGQKPPNNLLNPIAWSRFIQSLQKR